MLPIPELGDLPIEYQLTLRGRETRAINPEDLFANQRLLLANEDGLLVFASEIELKVLHDSEFWIADGTFEMRPRMFSQIYTIRSLIQNEGKSIILESI